MTKHICPYCDRVFTRPPWLTRHIPMCQDKPDVRAKLAEILDAGNGVIVTSREYDKVSAGLGLPTQRLLRNYYGTWADVAASFGLHAKKVVSRREFPCPHCGRVLKNRYNSRHHAERCCYNPEVRARVVAALDDGDGNIISTLAYERLTHGGGSGLPADSTLHKQVGTWAMVAEWAGLRMGETYATRQPGSENVTMTRVDRAALRVGRVVDTAKAEAEKAILPPEGIEAIPKRKRYYHWPQRRWIEQVVYELR